MAKRLVRYIGASDMQVGWGYCEDPRGVLTEGMEYEIERCKLHSWHTKVFLVGVDSGRGFPSAAFEPLPEPTSEEEREWAESHPHVAGRYDDNPE